MYQTPQDENSATQKEKSFSSRVLTALGIILPILLLILLFGYAFQVFLLVFAGILITVFFRGLSHYFSQRTGLPEGWSLLVTVLAVFAITTALFWLLAPQVSEQTTKLSEELPRSIENLKDQLQDSNFGSKILDELPDQEAILQNRDKWMSQALGLFSTTFGILGDLYVILFIGLFLTAQPKIYKDGIVALVPIKKRARANEVLDTLGATLGKWIAGKMFSMLVVGILSGVGLWILGIPMAIALAVFAGILSFIPNFGPLIALIPAVLVAFLQGPNQALYVVALYTGIQFVESNLLTPLIQKKMVEIPPALIIISQILLAVFTGGLGLILATPVMVGFMVLVKMLYVSDVLGDKSVEEKN